MCTAHLRFLFSPLFCLILLSSFGCKDQVSTLSIEAAEMEEGDSPGELRFQLVLDKAAKAPVVVNYLTEDGTAKEGLDYVGEANGSLSIPPGELSAMITVQTFADTFLEEDEWFRVHLVSIEGAERGTNTAVGTILNDDTSLNIPDGGYSTPDSYDGYTLAWADEFEGSQLDLSSWSYQTGTGCPGLCGWGNNEKEYYSDREENVYLTAGALVLEARKESYRGSDYSSGRIFTRDKKTFRHGRIDIRAILPKGQGIWPALWMLPQDNVYGGWPTSGEIDIMELVGHEAGISHGTIHYGQPWPNNSYTGEPYELSEGVFADGFHVFSIDWEEDRIRFYVDDNLFFTVTPTTTGTHPYPFNEDFYFLFNVAVGGNWPGDPDGSTSFPQRMIVDYVRVFEKE